MFVFYDSLHIMKKIADISQNKIISKQIKAKLNISI